MTLLYLYFAKSCTSYALVLLLSVILALVGAVRAPKMVPYAGLFGLWPCSTGLLARNFGAPLQLSSLLSMKEETHIPDEPLLRFATDTFSNDKHYPAQSSRHSRFAQAAVHIRSGTPFGFPP
jgi:hypothetical protein